MKNINEPETVVAAEVRKRNLVGRTNFAQALAMDGKRFEGQQVFSSPKMLRAMIL